jgi:triosephosphate isomerase
MARKLFMAGNWKMNTSAAGSVELANGMVGSLGGTDMVDLAVFPPLVYIVNVVEVLKGSNVHVGAQNMFYEDNGAYTGEISAQMLKDIGCRYVIVGHSERRHVIGETDELISRKVVKALSEGLEVIFCVGELLEELRAGRTWDVVARQAKIGLEGVSRPDALRVTIAYEPVWAIGTGETASPQQAQEVHAMIRGLLGELYDTELADSLRIQYGGSVKPGNAAQLMDQDDVDGALVGGASLKIEAFVGIVRAVL